MSSILTRIPQFEFPPRYAPEWGSGGIFGLKYHRGALIYTLAFEAEVHLQRETESVYRFDRIGEGPRSGGDTYNAVEGVDDNIYFGGWVHAPAVYSGRTGMGGSISFKNKFSHLHSYDLKEDKVTLIWKDTLADDSRWAGEVSQVLYDPVGDRLLISRADGHDHLGVYAVDRRTGEARRISEVPSLKGAPHMGYFCFDVRTDWTRGLEGIQTLDPVSGKWFTRDVDFARDSMDGGGAYWPNAGCAISAYSRLFFFVRGGVVVGDPLGELEGLRFVRLFDFGTDYSPSRMVCKSVGGGILVAFSAYSQSFIRPRNDFEAKMKGRANFVNGPTVLAYITPPDVRVLGAFGARITSFEKVGDKVVVAASTAANLSADDANPVDTGYRDLTVFDAGSLLSSAPPVTFVASGEHVSDMPWGGIPLSGRRGAELRVVATKDNELTVNEYDLSLPLRDARADKVRLSRGAQTVDLAAYRGVVSFKLETPDPQARFRISLV